MKNKLIYKIIVLTSLIGFTIESCAQNKSNSKLDINQLEKDIIQKEFGHSYRLKYEHNNCSYEILINDVPLITFYGLGERSTTAYINQYMLKPGKQEITIRMYPKKTDDTKFNETLDSTSFVKLKLDKIKMGSQQWEFSKEGKSRDWEEVLVYQTPKLEKDVPFVEFKIPFEASKQELTWEIKGWSDSQALVNNEALKKEVFDFYKNFQQVIENQDKNTYINLLAHSVFEEASADSWESKAFFKDAMEELANKPISKQKFLFPINENTTELKFYGNGRVVTLVSKDPRAFGYSPLVAKGEKSNFPIAYTFYLHKPKGSNKLEIIR